MSARGQSIWTAAVVVVAALASGGQAADPIYHSSYLHHALHELKLARHDLKESKHDFGGYKSAAVDATGSAIHHLEKLIGHPHYKEYTANIKPHLNEHHKFHSHTHHALHALKEAKRELKESRHDFGGQKHVALREIDVAITELEHVVKHYKK